MHLIKSIIESEGTRRFKKEGNDENNSAIVNGQIDLNADISDPKVANEIFRKMTTTTRYEQMFGAKPAAAQDFSILKQKPFSKLPSSQILKPHIVSLMSKWLTLNDQEKLTGRIFFTIRDMYTNVKS